MKMIHVYGEDYSALDFERSDYCRDLKTTWQRAMEEGGTWEYEDEDEEIYFDVTAYEFKDIDPEFINFIKDEILEYDDSKHSNFYFIDEKE